MKAEELEKARLTIKQTAALLGVHERTVIRMMEDGRLDGKVVDTPRGRLTLIHPTGIAALLIRKGEKKRYPRAEKLERGGES
jgi:excisionase family DNA binding protein